MAVIEIKKDKTIFDLIGISRLEWLKSTDWLWKSIFIYLFIYLVKINN